MERERKKTNMRHQNYNLKVEGKTSDFIFKMHNKFHEENRVIYLNVATLHTRGNA